MTKLSRYKKEKIIITGVAGFVGFHLAKYFLEKNYNILGIDNLNSYYDVRVKKKRLEILKKFKNFSFYRVDLRDKNLFFKKFKNLKIDIFVHLAAQAGVRNSILFPDEYLSNNIIATFNILEFLRNKKIKNYYFASTSSVYGKPRTKKIDENHTTDKPIQFYAATKKSCEVMAYSYFSLYKINTNIFRFFTLYGTYGRPDMALFKFTKNINKGKKIEVYNHGKHSRDFTYIDDAVLQMYKIIKSKNKGFSIFNIGNGKSVKLKKYISLIEKNLNKKAKIKYLPMQEGDVKEILSNNKKLKKIVKKSISTNVEKGVKIFVDWYKSFYSTI